MTKSGSVSIQMDEILRDVNEDAVSSMKKNVQKVAKESAQKLKNTFPRKSGSYAQGWAARRISDTEYVIYEKPQPRQPETPRPWHVCQVTEMPATPFTRPLHRLMGKVHILL